AAGGDGAVDAPARDRAGRTVVPLQAGHLARDGRRRRPARRSADEDLRRDGATMTAPNADEFAPILPGPGESDYERYLRTDELLALQQQPHRGFAHRDELLFMTVHQSSELWLQLAWNEVDHATDLLRRGEIAPALRVLYVRGREFEELYQLAEALIELDERCVVWRARHLKMVERVIGGEVVGTQGTPVELLSNLVPKTFYPELWKLRTELTNHSN